MIRRPMAIAVALSALAALTVGAASAHSSGPLEVTSPGLRFTTVYAELCGGLPIISHLPANRAWPCHR